VSDKSIRLSFNDLYVGQSEKISITITKNAISQFSSLTGDYHPLHTDEKYARENGFKNIIAHGLLTSSFSSKLIGMKLPGLKSIIVNQKFEYMKPAYCDDKITIHGEITKKDKRFKCVDVSIKILNEELSLLCTGKYLVKIRE
jgi:acyl dehydratase